MDQEEKKLTSIPEPEPLDSLICEFQSVLLLGFGRANWLKAGKQ